MPKEYRLKSYYKDISKIKDSINTTLLKQYKSNKWFLDDDNGFSLYDKFNNAKNNFIGIYGGPSSWTEQLFLYDYSPSQYSNILQNKELLLSNLQSGNYQQSHQCSDLQHYKLIKSIISRFKSNFPINDDPDNILWIIPNHRKLISLLLEYRTQQKQSISTFNNDLKTITRLTKITLGDTNELYKKLSQLQTDLSLILIERETGKNNLNRFEKIVNFNELLQVRDSLEQQWREKLANKGHKSKVSWEHHYKMLLLSAYTLTPCVRKELMSTKFASTEEDMLDDKFDYVFVPPLTGTVEYNFRICKKGKPAERYTIGYNQESRDKLSDIFRESLEIYPREFVFPKLKDMKSQTSTSNVDRMLRSLVKEHTLGVNMIRSSYITWRNLNNVTYNDMKDDAIRLRNSVETQQKDYRKIVSNIQQLPTQNLQANPIISFDHTDNLAKQKEYHKNYYSQNKQYIQNRQKTYNENNKQKYNAKRHADKANQTNIPPSNKMIEKWKLYQNDNGIWTSQYL